MLKPTREKSMRTVSPAIPKPLWKEVETNEPPLECSSRKRDLGGDPG